MKEGIKNNLMGGFYIHKHDNEDEDGYDYMNAQRGSVLKYGDMTYMVLRSPKIFNDFLSNCVKAVNISVIPLKRII